MEDGGDVFRGTFRVLGLEAVQQLTMRAGQRPKPASPLSKTT